jgi:general stress protein 26
MNKPVAAALVSLLVLVAPALVSAQDKDKKPAAPDRATLVAAAREIMAAQTYCALITIDESGRPQVRTMNPFPPDADMVVWMATNTRSRKVQQIRRDPRVTLYYSNHGMAIGYVALSGRAELSEDMAEILKRKRAYWDQAFPGLKNLTLLKVVPERLEVVNYKAGLNNDPETFRAPSIELTPASAPTPTMK